MPTPTRENCAFAHVASPGDGTLVILARPGRGLGISIVQGDPQAFETRVLERWMSLSGRTRPGFGKDSLILQGLKKRVDVFSIFDISSLLVSIHINVSGEMKVEVCMKYESMSYVEYESGVKILKVCEFK